MKFDTTYTDDCRTCCVIVYNCLTSDNNTTTTGCHRHCGTVVIFLSEAFEPADHGRMVYTTKCGDVRMTSATPDLRLPF